MERRKKFALLAGLFATLTGGGAVNKWYKDRASQQKEFDPSAEVVKKEKRDGGLKPPKLPDLAEEKTPEPEITAEDLKEANAADQASAAEKIDALRNQISGMDAGESDKDAGGDGGADGGTPPEAQNMPVDYNSPNTDHSKERPILADQVEQLYKAPKFKLNLDSSELPPTFKLSPGSSGAGGTPEVRPVPSAETAAQKAVERNGALNEGEQAIINMYLQTNPSLAREGLLTTTPERTSLNVGKNFYVVTALSNGGFRFTDQTGSKYVDFNNHLDGLTVGVLKKLSK